MPESELSLGEKPPATILVIEDDTNDQTMLLRQLKKSGIDDRVLCVEDGLDALDLLQTGARKLSRVAAIFLDLSLPGVDGLLLLETIRANVATALLPVFVMTGNTNPNIEAECRRLGATSFFPKRLLPLPQFRTTIGDLFRATVPPAESKKTTAPPAEQT